MSRRSEWGSKRAYIHLIHFQIGKRSSASSYAESKTICIFIERHLEYLDQQENNTSEKQSSTGSQTGNTFL